MLFIVLEEYIDSFIILDSLGLAVVPDIQITMNRDKRHIKDFINLVKDTLPPDVNLEDVDIWFQDETRVGQQGGITRVWALTGTRPFAIRQQQFNYQLYFCSCSCSGISIYL